MPAFRSLLYREPRLYDVVFPDSDGTTAKMVRTAMRRYLPEMPRSILDMGCGTGQHLQALATNIPECYGVDLLASNIAYARSVRAGIAFQVGDMRTVRLGRTFDLVTCLGNTLSYALTDQDLADVVSTFAAHAHSGTLIVADPLNARTYLEGGGFEERIQMLEAGGFQVLGMYDNREFKSTNLTGTITAVSDVGGMRGRKLYVFARKL
jgi:SAM-dependent methyltransferase